MTQSAKHTPFNDKLTVAVVGAGVVGLCTALEAQRHGFQVTLFDKGLPGEGASFGNAGYLATELIDPLATKKTLAAAPRMWMDPKGPLALPWKYLPQALPWLAHFVRSASSARVESSRQALYQLNQAAVPAWQRCLADIGAEEYLVSSGYLLVWESENKLDEAKTHAAYLAQWDIESVLLQGAQLREKEPELAETVSHALFFPNACRVKDPYLLSKQLFAVFQARGGCFEQTEVSETLPQENAVGVVTATSQNRFEHVVLCTGAWGKPLLEQTGISVPLEAERGYHLTIETADMKTPLLHHPIGSAERKFVMSPLASGLRVVGITEIGGLHLPEFARRFNVLRHHSRQLLPRLNNPSLKVSEWMGHRPTLADSLPVIDQHPRHPRLLFAFGNQHLGLTQAAISAELVISLLRQVEPEFDVKPYRVDRF
ncbi:NAD(P)/FAD-dependent oxidoreductase [Vibrio diabolicus]|uniref:FAD-dependent oxidoreductase n=1 Tax=Vibrio diabolicus TaxID=50719 RepID=A0AAX1XTD1_9VIBR|nr:FAD-dependent oxidoreductase [Vibrio diabolicus]MCS0349080.1 FAD-binding oxidoreductase [Vibrio diabolicus]MCS0362373.1 FAD-binding oxidoreductase [Vibrio diabolicus]MCS0375198.1 FAD-binding oxidoreductase [Vibrio diabolicus]MCS0427992.1 FAD-binding oxidoreductase [Vibrio diabolicus]MCS0442406.1 FAD-binding oxidoreductase [Vibrio diabolicus]